MVRMLKNDNQIGIDHNIEEKNIVQYVVVSNIVHIWDD